MKWEELEKQVEEYEEKYFFVPVIAVGGCIFSILIGAATELYALIFIGFIISVIAGMSYESSIAVKCPKCGKKIGKNPLGRRDPEILLLRNLHQCPHCQYKFD